ncbi:DEAD/DEAH box helicase family protein [Fusobacterium massiliense]|uniref:DEAD/DEAH box helicase family protein n=1 Tax=Fusobacterium massiliense TaxID=1852365 RepID=UPI00093B256D|nr:DEAD/DEAH box helicase family protein [Fusobacterium massiliense]
MSNFDFLKDEFVDLYELCLEAEKNCYIKPRTSAIYSRLALEFCVALVYKFENIQTSYTGLSLNELINKREFKDLFQNDSQVAGLNLIRKFGNDAAHMLKNIITDTNKNLSLSKDIALNCLKGIFDFTIWIAYCYGNTLKSDDIKFDEKYIINSSFKEENINDIKITDDDVKNNIEKIEEVPIKKRNTKINNSNFSEKETRKLFIDFLLMKAGWNVNDRNMVEYEVEGLKSTGSGKGNVDYILWGDSTFPLAIIEAKKTSCNAKKGEFQALEYAEALEKKFNFFPIRFVTNGFEIFIYENKNSIPRRVYGFYRKEELLKIVARRNKKITSNDISINEKIINRYYQERAVKKAIENYISGNRKSLLVMATGSGKTRVAISVVDCLSKLNMVKRTLFLADRVALVKQALNSFKNSLPDYTFVDLVSEKDRDNAKIVFSTYQTMMTESEKSREDGTNKYGVGAFDLIIVDEAHRSIYQKYGDLFEYFDSLILGLTATPKNEIDRNTFKVFDMNSKEPTDSYDLFEAAKDEFLLLPNIREISLNYPENGIVYSKLSEEEKEKYESLFDEEDNIPEEISGDSLNSWFFNEGTTSKVLTTLMEEGYKIESGDKLGKTIIFAKNDKHAEHIVETFNKLYKNLDGEFCQKITTKVEKAQTLIERFVNPNSLPQIAVSVDMLDTGIDIPQILNLVFYKKVKSKAKFWQMIGRGTRKCKDIYGVGQDKKDFLILDFCRNFSYFEMKDSFDEDNTKLGKSLSSRIFENKIKMIYKLQNLEYQMDENYKKLWEDLVSEIYDLIASLNEENISVRTKISYVKKYKNIDVLKNLEEKDVDEIIKNLSSLPFSLKEKTEMEKKFENLILKIQLKLFDNKKVENEKMEISDIAKGLAKKGTIKEIQKNANYIMKIIKEENYLKNIDILELKNLKDIIEPLTIFLDTDGKHLNYVVGDFEDAYISTEVKDINIFASAYINSKEKFQKYLDKNKELLSIKKLRNNIELDEEDLKELRQLLYSNEEVSLKNLKNENNSEIEKISNLYGKNESFGIFIRSLVGLDREAINKEFSEFLNTEKFNSNQIELINLIIENIVKYGAYSKSEIPKLSNDILGKSIDNIFTDRNDLQKIVDIIDKINSNVPKLL